MSEVFKIDKQWLRQSFDKAAPKYEKAAVLQQEIGERLIERLSLIKIQPHTIIDIGAGTGLHTRSLARQFSKSVTIALDLATGMLQQARDQLTWWQHWQGRQQFICADAEQLPLADQSVDLLFSNVALQWCDNPEVAFSEFNRVLRPGGLLLFSTFGPDTLFELRRSWQTIDSRNHVNVFIDMHDLGDALLRAGLSDPVMDMEMMTLTYTDLRTLMAELKTIGAHNVTHGRPRGLTGRHSLKQLTNAYETYRCEHDNRLPASYEVIYGHAWKLAATPHHGNQQHDNGEISIPLDTLTRSRHPSK